MRNGANLFKAIEGPDWKIRLYSYLFGSIITFFLVYFIFGEIGTYLIAKEPPIIEFRHYEADLSKPIISNPNREVAVENKSQRIEKAVGKINNAPSLRQTSTLTPNMANIPLNKHIGDGIIRNNPNISRNLPAGINDNVGRSNGTSELSDKAIKTLHDLECERINIDERPKDCPPNVNSRKMLDAANAPKYRPENVVGFSRGEIRAKHYAGWRDKCEMENGDKYQFCKPIGKKPPRVKTPYELCVEKGLGGCIRPPLPNGAKSDPILGFE